MMNSAPEYCFVVEDDKHNSFELEITLADDRAKKHFQSVWQRLSNAVDGLGKIEGITLPAWAEWTPWKWCEDNREAYQPRQKYVAWCGSNLVGILNVWLNFESSCDPGNRTLYVEHLAASPGNLTTELWNRRYSRVGHALLAYAVKLSQEQGTEGRVSLHASNAEALTFYEYLNQKLAGALFYPGKMGITGPTPQGSRSDPSKTYLETQPAGAKQLLEVYRA